MVRIGVISYLNTAPVFYPLEHGKVECRARVEFERGEPSTINAQFRLGRVDIAPISSVELRPGDLVAPDLSISANDGMRSVALFSRKPIDGLDGVKVGLTPASASAASLLKVLCWHFLDIKPEFVLMKSCEELDAALLIGDRALLERSFNRWEHVTDLAGLWTAKTGLPMTYAVFAHRPRPGGIARERVAVQDDLKEVARALRAARDWGVAHLEEVVDGVELPHRMTRAKAVEYLRSIDYSLGPRHQDALRLFYRLVRQHGIATPTEEVEVMVA